MPISKTYPVSFSIEQTHILSQAYKLVNNLSLRRLKSEATKILDYATKS